MRLDWDKPVKQLLIEQGFTVGRVYRPCGAFHGMRILRDGLQIHDKPVACVDYAIDLLKSLEDQ